MRVVLDARMRDGISGGVQQWVIGLASALSRLHDGTDEYLFLVDEGQADWLTPYLGGRCSLLVQPASVLGSPERGGIGRAMRMIAGRLPFLRRIKRRLVGGERARWLSPLHRTITQAGADVMHFTMQSAFSTTVPSIYQPWDLQHLHLPEFFTARDRASRDAAYRAFCAQASLIVVATKWVKADVAKQFGIALDRVTVVNPPPVTDAYKPPTPGDATEIAARLGLPPRYVFYPAQTWGHKNHERLFEALRILRDRGVEVPLICTGHRNERYAALMRRAADLGVEGQITFLGYLDPTEIQVVYRRATALIFPSLYEGWGLPIMEAFASGLAVGSSNVTSLPELVGDAAILFDPIDPEAIASAIERLWVHDDRRAELIHLGRARIAQFDWMKTALIMRAHYRRTAGMELDGADLERIAAETVV